MPRESRIITWVPAELVFNYADEKAAFARCNMPLFFPLVGMFRGFLDSESISDWQEDFLAYSGDWLAKNGLALTEGQRQSLLESRASVFQEMQRTFELDFDFFRRSAPPAAMTAPGRFELTASGRNRMAFLLAKGFRLLPLAVERDAYEPSAASEAVAPLRHSLGAASGSLLAPIPHPRCAMLPARFTDYARLFLFRAGERLMRRLCARHAYVDGNGLRRFDHARVRAALSATRVVCLLRDGGLAARYFASLGCRSAALFDTAWPEQQELSACLDGLYARLSNDVGDSGRVDILLLGAAADADIAGSLLERAASVCLLQEGETADFPLVPTCFEEQQPLFRSRTPAGDMVGRLFTRRS